MAVRKPLCKLSLPEVVEENVLLVDPEAVEHLHTGPKASGVVHTSNTRPLLARDVP